MPPPTMVTGSVKLAVSIVIRDGVAVRFIETVEADLDDKDRRAVRGVFRSAQMK